MVARTIDNQSASAVSAARGGAIITAVASLACLVASIAAAQPAPAPAAPAVTLRMVRVADLSSLGDPGEPQWQQAAPVDVTMLPQAVTTPMHLAAAIHQLRVRAAHDGRAYAFRIEWDDPTRSDTLLVDRFGDQVAVQLPMTYQKGGLPSPMMGNPGGRVAISQWRAAFQKDMDQGKPGLRDLHPNAIVDVYPDQVLAAKDAKAYSGALGVDNPVSRPLTSPVLDQMAEGYGSMTVQPEQRADGKGVWKEGRWSVVISHPFGAVGINDPNVRPGATTSAAFAVWDGGNSEVGSRKAWSSWVAVQVAD